MICDMHIHTEFSSDSATAPQLQLDRAVELGMKQICITDHQDYDYPPWHSIYLLSETGEMEPYLKKLFQLKEMYQDKIELLIGIEFGLQPHLAERINREYGQYPFDFVIGSTHCFGGRDTEDQTLYEGRSKEEAVRDYFETELRNLTLTDGYDVTGHLDFVLRDIPGKNQGFSYRTYGDILDEILLTVIRKGKGIECNTKSLVVGMGDSSPGKEIIRRYYELGGRIITFGSDAHFPERIGAKFSEAKEIVKSCGFETYCIYRKHEPVFLPLT